MPSRHALCTFKSVKRSIGRAGLDWCNAAVVNHLVGAVVYTLLPNKFTWEPFRNSPAKGRVMTEATYDALADCLTNRAGLNGDRREDEHPDKPPPPVDKDQAWARMERRSRCGSFDRWAQHHAPCPGCSGFACGECTVEGLWKEWNMNERSGSDQVADVEHVAARAAAAESILAFGDVPLARPVAPYGVGGVGAVRPLKEVAHGAPRSFARPAACRSADGHDVAVGRVSPSCVSGLWETFLRRGWRHSWLRARLVCFVQPRPTWLRWRPRRLSPLNALIPQLFREAPATCVECVCVSASHARLVGACGCVSGREGPETNERKGILKEYENLT